MFEGLYLSLMIGPAEPVPAPRPVMEALTSAQVTVSSGQRSGFQLTFALSKPSLLNSVLLPQGYFDPTTRVILVATVSGIPTVLMDGVITRQDVAPSNNPGQSTLTVTGEDLTVLMDLKEVSGRPFESMPAEARVEMIIADYAALGLVPVVIPSVLLDVPNPENHIPNQTGTDLGYIDELAATVGYVFYVDPGPTPGTNRAYWGPEVKDGSPQPALSVNMDASTNVELLSFSYDGFSKSRFILETLDETSKVTRTISLPDIGPLNPPLGAKPIPAMRVQKLETAPLKEREAEARGMASASRSADVITASGQLDVLRYGGVLQARRLVGVRGAGLAYDGLYYVKSVTHNIKRGEYKQSFTLTRNALIPFAPVVPV
jgi:hypothetical protein